jgi:hypothetical protein
MYVTLLEGLVQRIQNDYSEMSKAIDELSDYLIWWQFAMIDCGMFVIVYMEIEDDGNINCIIEGQDYSTCFAAGTKVATDKGLVNIEEIKVGDQVLSKDTTTGEVTYKKVLSTSENETAGIVRVYVGDETVECSQEHPFWVVGKGWVAAKDLLEADQVLTSGDEVLEVRKIEMVDFEEKIKTYNFQIADFHTYFITKKEILVHNRCEEENIALICAQLYKGCLDFDESLEETYNDPSCSLFTYFENNYTGVRVDKNQPWAWELAVFYAQWQDSLPSREKNWHQKFVHEFFTKYEVESMDNQVLNIFNCEDSNPFGEAIFNATYEIWKCNRDNNRSYQRYVKEVLFPGYWSED